MPSQWRRGQANPAQPFQTAENDRREVAGRGGKTARPTAFATSLTAALLGAGLFMPGNTWVGPLKKGPGVVLNVPQALNATLARMKEYDESTD
jgi:hypothetical protein